MAGKGNPKTGGRKKGTPNKIGNKVKEAIEKAFDQLGGVSYLIRVGENDPKTFCTLLSKLLPSKIEAEIDDVSKPLNPTERAARLVSLLSGALNGSDEDDSED